MDHVVQRRAVRVEGAVQENVIERLRAMRYNMGAMWTVCILLVRRLAEKLGYIEEARFGKARFVHGAYYDGMGYGVLREEWEQRYPAGFAAQL